MGEGNRMSCLGSTPRDADLLECAKLIMPEAFWQGASDDKILAYIEMVVNDLNWWPPVTNYTRANFPDRWKPMVLFGLQAFAILFKQMEASLQDFDYNDNGLSVRVDQVGKLNQSYTNILNAYKQQAEFAKKSLVPGMGIGLGTPRYQSQIGQFLKIALGSSFNWGNG